MLKTVIKTTDNVKIGVVIGLALQLVGEDGTWDQVLAVATGAINKKILEEGIWDPSQPGAIYYSIVMPCGHHLDFKTEADVWNLNQGEDIPCTCGDPKHWFVKWNRLERGFS